MTQVTDKSKLSRRDVLKVAGVGTVAALGAATLAGNANATPADVDAYFKKVKAAGAKASKVTVDGPEIAENGNTVPVEISVDAPQTEKEYVKTIFVAADGNPSPEVITFNLTPASGSARVKFRVRLATTQKVRAVAMMNDGRTFTGEKEIKVTIGGCGG
ncbi:thiosulfate oxidation carrier protein SoxY [Terasakiella sp. SH-1]|uniref:thiosulfate oxidation carrier protein SoxY n=1 Tax=Terasakiella sp. SH-1 TaxID=2560057 RepID=UPI001073A07F|nr:thiosulfate oxidation carrier protein SoxY [Terasakiella sp. SH-1]